MIDGNPLANIKDLRRVTRVMKNGQVFERRCAPAAASGQRRVARLKPTRYADARDSSLRATSLRLKPSRYDARLKPSRYEPLRETLERSAKGLNVARRL